VESDPHRAAAMAPAPTALALTAMFHQMKMSKPCTIYRSFYQAYLSILTTLIHITVEKEFRNFLFHTFLHFL
jgi:hypothetical protein